MTTQLTSDRQWHTITERAASIQVSRETVWQWIRDHKLRSRRFGSIHRISDADWQECLDNFNNRKRK